MAMMSGMLLTGGCATVNSIATAERGTPIVFSGARLDLGAIADDERGLRRFKTPPPAYPGLDLPFSLVADTFAFPLSAGVAAYEWLFHEWSP
jgi:uncharacterized protein YceK